MVADAPNGYFSGSLGKRVSKPTLSPSNDRSPAICRFESCHPHHPPFGASSSGRTSRFERENPGSNPGAPANLNCERHVNSAARVLACLVRSHGFESHTWRHLNAPIAQRVERLVEAQEVAGSKPARCTTRCLASSKAAMRLAVNQETVGSNPTSPTRLSTMCTHSSSGRAPLLQSGGPWFDPRCVYHTCDVSSVGTEHRFAMPEVEGSSPSRRATHHAALAQRTRVPGFDPGGRRFESCTPHQLFGGFP